MNIAGSLGVDVGSQLAGTTVQGSERSASNGVTLDTRNDRLFFLDQLDEVRETITADDLEELSGEDQITLDTDTGSVTTSGDQNNNENQNNNSSENQTSEDTNSSENQTDKNNTEN